jgi:serine/threonine-protein kinase
MAGCPNDDLLGALTEGRLDARETAELHAHVDGCQSCQWLLRELAASGGAATDAAREEPPVAPVVFAPGAELGGRYRLERRLGSGAMGTVWAALHVGTERRVALKILRRDRDDAPTKRLRFLREARLLGRVDHPNLVPVHDVFEDRGVAVLAMDLLDGESLGERLRRDGRLPLAEAARLLVGAFAAVDAAHAAGVVHRDLKPDNLFVTRGPDGPTLRVLDFGLAKLVRGDDSVPALTAAGEVLGTPPYMAPEQFRGEAIDRRADVWAFGVVLYECLSGQRPFSGERFAQYFERVTTGARAPITEVAPALPRDVAALVERMLAVDARARPADLRQCMAVLRRHTDDARRRRRRVRGAVLITTAAASIAIATFIVHGRAGSRAVPPVAPAPSSAAASAPAPASASAPAAASAATEDSPTVAPAGSACERAWDPPLAARLCHAPLVAMRESSYRTGAELETEGADEPRRARVAEERRALARALDACAGADACLLERLRATDSKTNIVDCARAVSQDARAICRSVPLATLAGSLAAHYRIALEHYAHDRRRPRGVPAPQTLSSDQTAWLIARHRCGADESCLTQTFEARIAALRAIHHAFLGD